MAANPIPILFTVILTLVFQVILYGEETASQSFPSFEEWSDECEEGGNILADFFNGIKCLVAKIGFIFRTIGGAISFYFQLTFFNVTGAPWYIKVTMGSIINGAMGWSLITLFRGN